MNLLEHGSTTEEHIKKSLALTAVAATVAATDSNNLHGANNNLCHVVSGSSHLSNLDSQHHIGIHGLQHGKIVLKIDEYFWFFFSTAPVRHTYAPPPL